MEEKEIYNDGKNNNRPNCNIKYCTYNINNKCHCLGFVVYPNNKEKCRGYKTDLI